LYREREKIPPKPPPWLCFSFSWLHINSDQLASTSVNCDQPQRRLVELLASPSLQPPWVRFVKWPARPGSTFALAQNTPLHLSRTRCAPAAPPAQLFVEQAWPGQQLRRVIWQEFALGVLRADGDAFEQSEFHRWHWDRGGNVAYRG